MGKIMFNGVDYSAPSTAGVTGVKGNAESSYRTGNVNITPANIGALATTGDASNTTTAFTQASTRSNLTTKEKISVSFGKIMKWFADLKTVAFTGSYNDLSNKPTIPSAYTLPSATSTTLGGVKTTDSSAVTNSTGLALAATEKNASINGTLANQISTLNSNLSVMGGITVRTVTLSVDAEAGKETEYVLIDNIPDGTYIISTLTHVDNAPIPDNKRLFMAINSRGYVGASLIAGNSKTWQWAQTMFFKGTNSVIRILPEFNFSAQFNMSIFLMRIK